MLSDRLVKMQDNQALLSKEYTMKMADSWRPSEVLKEGLRRSQERSKEIETQLDTIKVNPLIVKESIDNTQIYSVLENTFFTIL